MTSLIFCRDKTLRRSFHAYDSVNKNRVMGSVPVQAWEAAVDPHVFLKSLGSTIRFEDGLTVGEMMENLAPWADIMTGVACMDFPAFLEEARTPEAGCEQISHIDLYYSESISPVPRFERVKEMFTRTENGLFTMNIGKPLFTGELQTEKSWDYAAMLTDEGKRDYEGSESVSLSFTPVSEYAHLPLRFRKTAIFYDETSSESRNVFLGTRKALTRADHPNVNRLPFGTKGRHRHQISIVTPAPTFYAALVRGFLWEMGFSYSPVQRDVEKEKLEDSIKEMDAIKAGNTPDPTPPEEIDEEFIAEMAALERATQAAMNMGLTVTELTRGPDDSEF